MFFVSDLCSEYCPLLLNLTSWEGHVWLILEQATYYDYKKHIKCGRLERGSFHHETIMGILKRLDRALFWIRLCIAFWAFLPNWLIEKRINYALLLGFLLMYVMLLSYCMQFLSFNNPSFSIGVLLLKQF